MTPHHRRRRLLEPQTSHFEYITVEPWEGEERWYRRGPPCPTCDTYHHPNGVVLQHAQPDGREECIVCTMHIDVREYGPRQVGKVRVQFPPESNDVADNPYLNPTRNNPAVKDVDEALVIAGLNDVGNGRRLAISHGEQLRYTAGWGWLVYDGRRWQRDQLGTAMRMAKATVEACQSLDLDRRWRSIEEEHGFGRKDFQRHLETSLSRGKLEAMLAMACSEPDLVARTEDFDQESWLINCNNGIVDLTTGTLRPHDPELFITQLIPHEYPAHAAEEDLAPPCPGWDQFLRVITCGDDALVDFLQRAVGYTLTGDVREQKLFFLYGDGANGKSTFLEMLRHLMGDYSTHLSFEALLKSRNASPEQGFAHLPGKRYATASEAGEGRAWNEEAVKAITGGDTVRAKILYKDQFEFRPVAKIWVAANDRPRIDGVNEGIWRRFFLVPFAAEIPAEKRDPNLLAALKEETPAILAWAARGALRWYREGLRNVPASMRAAFEEYRTDNDALANWIADCCVLAPGQSTNSRDLLASYNEFAKENKERELTQTALGTRLHKLKGGHLTKSRSHGGRIRWDGIGLKVNLEREDAFASFDRK